MDNVIEKWDEILQTVKRDYNISDVAFNTWLKPLEVYDVTDNVITILEIPRSDEIIRWEDQGKTVIEGDAGSEISRRFFDLAEMLLKAEEEE